MAQAIEPCIYPVDETKTKPAGFRVRKVLMDQWGDRRQHTKIFRHPDRSQALENARSYVRQLDEEKTTREHYRRFSNQKTKSGPRLAVGYSIPWHEYPEEWHADIERELEELARKETRQFREANRPTLREYVEDEYLAGYEQQYEAGNLTKGTLDKKKSAWGLVQEYDRGTGAGLADTQVHRIRPADIDNLIVWMQLETDDDGKTRWSTSTLKGYLSIIRSFFKAWSEDEGESNPAASSRLKSDLKKVSGRRKSEKVIPPDHLSALEKGIEKEIKSAGKRWLYCRIILRYIHRVLKGSGLRVSELAYLEKKHIDFDLGLITVEGAVVDGEPGPTKRGRMLGNRDEGVRVVPVSDDALEAIRKWLEIRSEHKYPNDCPVIFCGRDGSYLTDNQVRDYYARASKAAKLKRNVTPHMIRHTVNDRLRRDGVAADVRQKILGHADVRTNANYTAPKFSEGLDAMRRLKLT